MPNAWLLQIAVFFFVKSRNGSLNEFTTTEYGGRVGGGGGPFKQFFKSWYTDWEPKQGFRCGFTDRFIQSLVSSVLQAILFIDCFLCV